MVGYERRGLSAHVLLEYLERDKSPMVDLRNVCHAFIARILPLYLILIVRLLNKKRVQTAGSSCSRLPFLVFRGRQLRS